MQYILGRGLQAREGGKRKGREGKGRERQRGEKISGPPPALGTGHTFKIRNSISDLGFYLLCLHFAVCSLRCGLWFVVCGIL